MVERVLLGSSNRRWNGFVGLVVSGVVDGAVRLVVAVVETVLLGSS